MSSTLSTTDHSRDVVGLRYIYPVISRRSGGLSIGINFNTNNACNWRCIYCQVPNLKVGAAPELDFQLLETELRGFLNDVANGDFFDRFAIPEANRVIKDIAISGNGEPTSLKGFSEAIALIAHVATEFSVFPSSRFVLISNGSLIHQSAVQQGLRLLNQYHGEVWFKFDSATEEGRKLINNSGQSLGRALANLKLCAQLCRTKLQICLIDYMSPDLMLIERNSLLSVLRQISKTVSLDEILLYTVARPSMQPEAASLSKLSEQVLNGFADELRKIGFRVSVCP